MSRTKRAIVTIIFAVFVFALAIRPLFSNPSLSGLGSDGLFDWQNLLYLPIVVVATVLVVYRIRSLSTEPDGNPSQDHRNTVPDYGWADETDEPTSDHETYHVKETADDETDDGKETADSETDDEKPAEDDPSVFLSGQGGAREKHFEIEERPPEAELSGHLEHLREQFGDDAELRSDLDTLERVVSESETSPIPERCPHEHCTAAWEARGVVGLSTGRYELLDDGQRVLCLECERTVPIEELEQRLE